MVSASRGLELGRGKEQPLTDSIAMSDHHAPGGFASCRSEKGPGRTIPNHRWESQAAETRSSSSRTSVSLPLPLTVG